MILLPTPSPEPEKHAASQAGIFQELAAENRYPSTDLKAKPITAVYSPSVGNRRGRPVPNSKCNDEGFSG